METLEPGSEDNLPVFHKVRDVRLESGMSLRHAARLLHWDIQSLQHQEAPTTDLRFSELNTWAEALDVDVTELLYCEDDIASAQKLKSLMKAAATIYEKTKRDSSAQGYALLCMQFLVQLNPALTVFVPQGCSELEHHDVVLPVSLHAKKTDYASTSLCRIADLRERQGITLRTATRFLFGGKGMQQGERAQVLWQESGSADLRISQLQKWSELLGLPLREFFDNNDSYPRETEVRGKMLLLMKSVVSILEAYRHKGASIKKIACEMQQCILNIMPELEDAAAWPTYGQKRPLDELGIVADRVFSDERLADIAEEYE